MTAHVRDLRPRLDLSTGWSFSRQREGRAWLRAELVAEPQAVVDLPHCWNTRDTFADGTAYYQGWGAYRREFEFSASDPQSVMWRLQSEGFYGVGDVWLNGTRLANVDGQYLGFDLDAGPALQSGRNVLAVRLDNRYRRHTLPGIRMPDFLLYGGLAGRVELVGIPRLHFADDATWVSCARADDTLAHVSVSFAIHNESGSERTVQMRWRLEDSAGRIAAEDVVGARVPAGVEQSFTGTMQLTINSPQLWSVGQPTLYTAVGTLQEGDRVIDCVRMRFGCRQAEFRPDAGFFLNGERVELRGSNRHESMPGFGNALPTVLHRADARLMKSLGLNFVRLSHYPQHPAFLDACDELGLLVYAEIATWKSVRTGGWLRAAARQMRAMIARDRRHPSVIMWGMGNESRSRRAFGVLRDIATELDSTRPVIYAENHFYRARRQRTLGIPDVWGCNYELDTLADGCAASKLRNVVVSECANYPPAARGDLDAEAQQVKKISRELEQLRDSPFVAGFALWNWNDYATLRKQRYARTCGIVDAWRMPKMAAAWLQARNLNAPCLRLWGDWSETSINPVRTIHIVTNCAAVELWLNGHVWKTLEGTLYQAISIPFETGELVAHGIYAGQAASDRLIPHGPAVRLTLCEDDPCSGLGDSALSVWRVRVSDAQNRLVANWQGAVAVSVAGPGRLMAHTAEDTVAVSGGEGRVWIMRSGGGEIVVTVRAEGLEPAVRNLPRSASH